VQLATLLQYQQYKILQAIRGTAHASLYSNTIWIWDILCVGYSIQSATDAYNMEPLAHYSAAPRHARGLG